MRGYAPLFLVGAYLLFAGCSPRPISHDLPNSLELGSPRGQRWARVITHNHSPYSYDACFHGAVQPDGSLDETCLQDLRTSFCRNAIDFTFMTDHPNAMARFEFRALLLLRGNDTEIVAPNGQSVGNHMEACEGGIRPYLTVGFEGQLLALNMNGHLIDEHRESLYGGETAALVQQLRQQANALVVVPHTESRSLEKLREIAPDAIEIYNGHANLDPKIRKQWLNLPPFSHLPDVSTYLVDPFREMSPDLAFLGFLNLNDAYLSRWNELVYGGMPVAGLVGTDSHQNVFAQKVADGESFGSHRRLSRYATNHFLTSEVSPAAIRQSLQSSQVLVVFEGLGSPVGFDFHAQTAEGEVAELGQSLSLAGSSITLEVQVPTVHGMHGEQHYGVYAEAPVIRAEIRQVMEGGKDQVVAGIWEGGKHLHWEVNSPGIFRTHIYMRPKHLRGFLPSLEYQSDREYPWIISNHIFIKL